MNTKPRTAEQKRKHAEYMRLYYHKNKERNKDKLKKYAKKWNDKSEVKERKYKWYKDNKDKVGIRRREIYATKMSDLNYRNEYNEKKRVYFTQTETGKQSRKRAQKNWIANNKDKVKLYSKRRKYKATLKVIRFVYEDNIKKYGTLTCYLCEKPIDKKEHLEHKIPLARGGTNNYDNLGIACPRCNCRKRSLTEQEFRQRYLPSDV